VVGKVGGAGAKGGSTWDGDREKEKWIVIQIMVFLGKRFGSSITVDSSTDDSPRLVYELPNPLSHSWAKILYFLILNDG